jgi:aromatic ring-opening dioxygenase catalytic subunit (LigB family)
MTNQKMPVFFVSHGGGPWPFVDGMKQQFALTEREFKKLPARLPARPKAVLVITGHWEADEFTVSTAERPPMEYDYYGFPPHTYSIKYPAPGSPALAARVTQLLAGIGITARQDPRRGFDHGTFVPLGLMYPDADVPIVMLSMKSGYDPAEHIRAGQALAPLREEGVLIVGSGLTYHNMRGFNRSESTAVAEDFEAYLNDAITASDARLRNDKLVHWQQAPAARLAHPQEDHLIPLMVVAGAAGDDAGHRVFVDHVMKVAMASYEFGGLAARGP